MKIDTSKTPNPEPIAEITTAPHDLPKLQNALLGPLQRKRRMACLSILLSGLIIACLCHGAVSITVEQVVSILGHQVHLTLPWPFEPKHEVILYSIRLPRILLGTLIGSGIATSGAALQGLFRNPLADPGLVGVSSGAAVAAVAVIVLGSTALDFATKAIGPFALSVAAFVGGTATTFLVYKLSLVHGRVAVSTMLLAGIAINAIAGSIIGVFTFVADDAQLRSLTFWSLGSLGGATWPAVATTAPFTGLSVIALLRYARPLNALLLGEEEAGHLGYNVESMKRCIVLLVALSVGATVAVAGIIGFIGLVVPHLLRLILGPDHRLLLPGSALLGASLLLGADLVARLVVVPAELPIGIVTALIGGPFFIYLLHSGRRLEGY